MIARWNVIPVTTERGTSKNSHQLPQCAFVRPRQEARYVVASHLPSAFPQHKISIQNIFAHFAFVYACLAIQKPAERLLHGALKVRWSQPCGASVLQYCPLQPDTEESDSHALADLTEQKPRGFDCRHTHFCLQATITRRRQMA